VKKPEFSFVLISIICISCELVIDVSDSLDYEDQLVLVAVLQPDSMITISVASSRFILDKDLEKVTDEQLRIHDATVRIYEDGVLLGETDESLSPDDPKFEDIAFAQYLFPFRAKSGSNYRVEVKKNGFPTITAEETIERREAITSISDMKFFISSDDEFLREVEVEITLQLEDRPGEDYYQVIGFGEYTTSTTNIMEINGEVVFVTEPLGTQRDKLSLRTNSLAIEDYLSEQIIFDDRFFEGSDFKMVFTISWQYENRIDFDPEARIQIIVNQLSKSYYNYIATAELQEWLEGDPFAESVQIYSNVENGLGFFGSYNSLLIEIPVK